LNLEIPEIKNYLAKDKKGNIIYPNGSVRDVFLHVEKGKEKEVKVEERLKDMWKV